MPTASALLRVSLVMLQQKNPDTATAALLQAEHAYSLDGWPRFVGVRKGTDKAVQEN